MQTCDSSIWVYKGGWEIVDSDVGVEDVLVDTADTCASGGLHPDETVLTPARAPGVSHDVVLNTVVLAPADGDDGVVDGGRAAVGDSDNTGLVLSEDVVAGGNSNVDGLLGETGQVVGGAIGLTVGGNVGDSLAFIVLAIAVLGSVGVVRLGHSLAVLEPVVGPEVPATVATFVTSGAGAVNELLLGHDDKVVAGNFPGGLDGLNGGESPA